MSDPAVVLYNLSPALRLLLLAAMLASAVGAWVWSRHRADAGQGAMASRVQALALVTLFLTFDLVLFGAFTRLTDSGLGCPDWPGCYGHASPLGADAHITAAQEALPTGPVTQSKAWVEMVHRYLATGVGALITGLVLLCARRWPGDAQQPGARRQRLGWALACWVWVCVQGAFGALTVTMRLFPAIVTLHLLGGYVLLALLVGLHARLRRDAERQEGQEGQEGRAALGAVQPSGPQSAGGVLGMMIAMALVLLLVQAASGAWVSSNYAVLACTEFPTCSAGQWWPQADWAGAMAFWRPLGVTATGAPIAFEALVAIHLAHRALAVCTLGALAVLAAALWRAGACKPYGQALAGLLALQALTGMGNVVLGWPLLGAVLHTGGAGAMVMLLVAAWLRVKTQ